MAGKTTGAAVIAAFGPHGVFVMTPKAMREFDRQQPVGNSASKRRWRKFSQLTKGDQQRAKRMYREGAPLGKIADAVHCFPGSIVSAAVDGNWNRGDA